MPESGAAGRKVRSTRAPVCKPTPVVLIELFRVRCLSMAGLPFTHPGGRRSLGFARRLKELAAAILSQFVARGAPVGVTHAPGPCVRPRRRVIRSSPIHGNVSVLIRLLAQESRN